MQKRPNEPFDKGCRRYPMNRLLKGAGEPQWYVSLRMQDRPNEMFKGCRRRKRESPYSSPSSPAQLLFLASPKCVPANTPKWQRLSPKATFSFYESCLNLSRIYGSGRACVGCHKGCNIHRHLFPHISNKILCFFFCRANQHIWTLLLNNVIYTLYIIQGVFFTVPTQKLS